jgi:hypothetical protein
MLYYWQKLVTQSRCAVLCWSTLRMHLVAAGCLRAALPTPWLFFLAKQCVQARECIISFQRNLASLEGVSAGVIADVTAAPGSQAARQLCSSS